MLRLGFGEECEAIGKVTEIREDEHDTVSAGADDSSVSSSLSARVGFSELHASNYFLFMGCPDSGFQGKHQPAPWGWQTKIS